MKAELKLLIAVFFLSAPVLRAEAAESVTKLREKLEAKIKASGIPAGEMSLYISSGEEGDEVVLDVNSKKALIPASISKVATASAALDAFPPGHKFKTSLWVDGTLKEGVLKGSMTLLGGGDPSFVSENMWFLVNQFLRAGIKRIDGDLIVDDSLFDEIRYDESREDSRVDRAYDAPVGAMSFNWNSVNVFVRPAVEAGKPALVFLDPENAYGKLVNRATTVGGQAKDLQVERKSGGVEGDTLIVSGKIGVKQSETAIFKNITRPELWAGENLKSFLAQRGIEVTGKVKPGRLPKTAEKAAESESKSIELVVGDMNKFSNNYVAEMLTKNMAALDKTPATLASGVARINKHLRDLRLPEDQVVFKNPSGLTRDNRLSAFAMWKILNHLKTDFRVQPEFLMSLPISGVDGTLKSRMKSPKTQRWVRAKTGLLTGVTALAGYAGREDGKVFTFVFIHNGPRDGSRMRSLFDEWLGSLID